MKRLLLLPFLLLSLAVLAGTITVNNLDELRKAEKKAQPGDIILLRNGEWKNVQIKLTCKGTKEKPITIGAETAGKVFITGHSFLKIGGDHIIVKGLYFQQGYAGDGPIIDFRAGKELVANNCRVTECAIVDFNNPRRMDENYWISFYGKNNRLDHCTFRDKKNMGVMIAVILDDERSRENFHSIDHNYFDGRPPLASNSGEIIRVGVSQHCQFNSNTQITDNLFRNCDGETEIVSIKSGGNIVKNNLFRECQGGVVLRHGDNNTVENNLFYGSFKEGTGGVRVINKGQWVVNNLFFACRGVDFRSPLSVMNGIPNSPAHRYVQVTDAVIANNTFYECSAASFCEGSDEERSLPPANVFLANNIFYNSMDSSIYKVSDDIGGFTFIGNRINRSFGGEAPTAPGFMASDFYMQKNDRFPFPVSKGKVALPDSLQKAAIKRLGHPLSSNAGFANISLLRQIIGQSYKGTGCAWLPQRSRTNENYVRADCKNAAEVYEQLKRKEAVAINLTGTDYHLTDPFTVSKNVLFTASAPGDIRFHTGRIPAVFLINGRGALTLRGLSADGSDVKAGSFVCSDTSGSSNHYSFAMYGSSVRNLNRGNGCEAIFRASKSTVADSIVIRENQFAGNFTDAIMMADEKDDKGYYNAEKIYITGNRFDTLQGTLLNIYRGGNDESTMGPQLVFTHNEIRYCRTMDLSPLITFTGVQHTSVFSNNFLNSNPGATLIVYKDIVRARHLLGENVLDHSGSILKNDFVINGEETSTNITR